MSCCGGAAKVAPGLRNKNKYIEQQNLEDLARERRVKKLLLLGAGESGKSTFFKQITSIYGNGYDDAERANYRRLVHKNVVASIKTLVRESKRMRERDEIEGCEVSTQNGELAEKMLETGDEDELTPALAAEVQTLWDDPGIQKTYDNRAKFQLIDNVSYFFSHLTRISDPAYSATDDDVVNTRVRTTGIVEMAFTVNKEQFKVMDVGGQRNERRKWASMFDQVTAVLFVASAAEYDQVLLEDSSTNRMVEAISLFDEICNSFWFKDATMILFLNKRDLFEIKLKKVPLADFYPEFEGGDDYEAACEFIQAMFHEKNKTGNKVYTHMTCATDKDSVGVILSALIDVIVRKALSAVGFM